MEVSPTFIVFVLSMAAGLAPLVVAQLRGYDWYAAADVRKMRVCLTLVLACWGIGYFAASALLSIASPSSAAWALPVGVAVLAACGVLLAVALHRSAQDPAERSEMSPAQRRRFMLVGGVSSAVLLGLLVGVTDTWLSVLAIALPLWLLFVLHGLLIRFDWPRRTPP